MTVTENWIDIIIIGISVVSIIWGLWRGFMQTSFSILSVVVAFYVAKENGILLFVPLSKLLGSAPFALALSYVIVFCMAMLLFNVLTYLLCRGLRKMDMGGFDTFAGGVFGAVRGLLFSIFFVLLLDAAAFDKTKIWANSTTVPYVGGMIKMLTQVPYIKEYKQWLRFDSDNRPQIVIPKAFFDKKGKTIHLDNSDIEQRDKVLDDTAEDLVRHSNLGKHNKASELAVKTYKKRQEEKKTPFQHITEGYKNLLCSSEEADQTACLTDE